MPHQYIIQTFWCIICLESHYFEDIVNPLSPGEGRGCPKDPQLSKSLNALKQVFIMGWNVMTKKPLNQNFEKNSWGTPILAPRSAVSPKMTTPALPLTPLFYCRIPFYSKNVDVCKKLEVNPLRFDRVIRVLSKKEIFSKKIFFFNLR